MHAGDGPVAALVAHAGEEPEPVGHDWPAAGGVMSQNFSSESGVVMPASTSAWEKLLPTMPLVTTPV